MAEPTQRRRVGWPVLVALLAMLGVAAYLVWRSDVTRTPVAGGATIGSVEPSVERSDADTWRHHAWARDGGTTAGTGPSRLPPVAPSYDPQRSASERAFGADAGRPFAPITRGARLVSREGLELAPDTRCEVRVLPARTLGFNCLVRVTCEGSLLYPNASQTGGYVRCELEDGAPARAEDPGHTALDGDPRLTLDLRAGTAEVADRGDGVDGYRATLRLD